MMRRRLLNGLLAGCLAVSMVVGGSAKPARAVDASFWINVAVAVAGSLFGGGGGGVTPAQLERAKREILGAINQSQQEILAHIDGIAAADVRACARSNTLLMPNIDQMDIYTLSVFLDSSLNCATLSSAYFDAVQDLGAADHIARVMGEIYSIAMVTFAKFGFDSTPLLDDLIASYEAVLNKIKPACGHSYGTIWDPEFAWVTEHTYACRAHTGDVESWTELQAGSQLINPIDYAFVETNVMRNTVRPSILRELPRLKQIRAGA
ncbi:MULTISPECIES: hypothetical protein [unclassified Plantactinospora]|uniref:hypothetical protein n=1 Tax=unclassified Plantactinospora TaxID=2631981 RepID=UPI00131F2569|nr:MULTISPECIES: hypothetical protein [unclassified Plantactinospora]